VIVRGLGTRDRWSAAEDTALEAAVHIHGTRHWAGLAKDKCVAAAAAAAAGGVRAVARRGCRSRCRSGQ
jgi:hypothetical protein